MKILYFLVVLVERRYPGCACLWCMYISIVFLTYQFTIIELHQAVNCLSDFLAVVYTLKDFSAKTAHAMDSPCGPASPLLGHFFHLTWPHARITRAADRNPG